MGVRLLVAVLFVVALVVFSEPASGAVSASPTRGYVSHAGGDAVAVLDPATNTVVDRVPLDFDGRGFEVRPDGRELYVVDFHGHRVVVISTVTNTVVASIDVGLAPSDVAFTPDSRRAYVTGDPGVTVVDTTTRRVVASIPLRESALDSAVSLDGSRVYTPTRIIVGLDSIYELKVISTETNRVTKNLRFRIGGVPPSKVIFAPNGRIAVLDTGEVFDTSNDTLSHTITMRSAIADLEFTPDSARIYVSHVCRPNNVGSIDLIDVASGQTLRTISTGDNPRSLELTSDGTRLYVTGPGAVQGAIKELDAATGQVLDTFGVADSLSMSHLELSDTAPPVMAPGRRFAPLPPIGNPCFI
jgi:YVTN family beta-propeller protein